MAMYEIISNKNVSEIVSALRSKGYQLDMIPSDISGGVRSSFSAVLHGSGGGMLGGRNEPGVKVVIYDSGDKILCKTELNANALVILRERNMSR